jgi:F-type H+-transporting ATPase subunit a
MVLHKFHLGHEWLPTVGSIFITLMIVLIGLYFKRSLAKDGDNLMPSGKFSLRHLIEAGLDVVYGLAKDNCGPKYRNFLPLLAALFFFILFCNMSGLIPGLPPPTENMSHNLAMGIVVFLVYNYAGIKEHGGLGYLKTFMGPLLAIAPLFFCIEMVSHAARPASLALRLAGNIFGDHMLLGVMTGMTVLVAPSFLMFFGLLVAVIQSFVFTLLTAIYVSMAISHDH